MKIWPHTFSDWCHLCGKRKDVPKLDIYYPKNAEHSKIDEKYIRICAGCITLLYKTVYPQGSDINRPTPRRVAGEFEGSAKAKG